MAFNWKKFGTFVGGVLFGTAGIGILSSKDAKKLYTHVTAAVLRGKDCVVKKTTTLSENCSDIYHDAKDINEKRYEEDGKIIKGESKFNFDEDDNEDKPKEE